MKLTAKSVKGRFKELEDKERAAHSQRFFKTGKGEYGEGDRFLGIRVPYVRKEVRAFRGLPLEQVVVLLHSSYHEERLFALLMLVEKFKKGSSAEQEEIYTLYLANTEYINNWDLIDSSAHYIVGGYLVDKDRSLLNEFARSDSLWHRRIAVLATFYFIKDGDYKDALRIASLLLKDKEDLIHKAVGWMLREIGNRDRAVEECFLQKHYRKMPRTMLRYAIEKFEEPRRKAYLAGTV